MGTDGRALVLIVEDDPDLREVLAGVLERAGYRPRTAADGLEALCAAAGERPSLILLDLAMPRMGGREFAPRFRAQHGGCVPIILLSGDQDARAVADELGAAALVEKPFSRQHLLAIMRQVLPSGRAGLRRFG